MMKKMVKIVGLMATLACGSAFAAAEGDIWEIVPCAANGTNLVTRPVSSIESPLPSGETFYFKIRLISRVGEPAWYLAPTTPGASEIDALRICVYVSGKPTYATRIGDIVVDKGDHSFTEVIFEYTVKPGDFALPVLLGTDKGPAGEVEALPYAFDPFSKWQYFSQSAGGETSTCNWWFFRGNPFERGEPPPETVDMSLRGAGFYLKTIDFAADWEEPGKVWRSVHEGSTVTVGPNPSLEAEAAPEKLTTLYVWSTNEAVLRVKSDKIVTMRTGGSASSPTYADFHVAAVTILGGQLGASFEIEGVSSTNMTGLVLSAVDHFTYSDATEERNIDYLTVPVQCVGPLPPSIKIQPEKSSVTATIDYLRYVTELQVQFSQAYSNDVTFTITPVFESDEARAAGADWKDYIRVSGDKEISSLASATNFTFTIPAGSHLPMENGSERKIYLYALRGDKWTTGAAHLQFVATTDDPVAAAAIGGFNATQGDMNVYPTAPTAEFDASTSTNATAGVEKKFNVLVQDGTYADYANAEPYEILICTNSSRSTDFGKLDGFYKPDPKTGTLIKVGTTDGLPSVTYGKADIGEATTIIRIQSRTTGETTDIRIVVNVDEPLGFEVYAIDSEGERIKTTNYKEGEDEGLGTLAIAFKNGHKHYGDNIYAFLVPENEASRAAIDCTFLAEAGKEGLEISGNGGAGADNPIYGTFVMIDGRNKNNSNFGYKIELRTAQVYEDGEPVREYGDNGKSDKIVLNSYNIDPSVDSVDLGAHNTEDDSWGNVMVAMGVEQTFLANVNEPSLTDLRATNLTERFQCQWKFTCGPSSKYADNADANGVVYGNPEENPAKVVFDRSGTWKCSLKVRDKDQVAAGTSWSKITAYEYTIVVTDQPFIHVTGSYGTGGEYDETRAYFYELESATESTETSYANVHVALDFNECGFPLDVRLTVVPPSASAADNPGAFVLQEGSFVKKVAENVYDVTFRAGVREMWIPVKALDGTILSRSTGFAITPAVTTENIVPNSGGKRACDYYVASADNRNLKVYNSEPTIEMVSPLPGTNRINVAIGTVDQPITWNFTDVPLDFDKGITVEIKGGGGLKTNFTSKTEANAFGAIGFKPTFKTSGEQTVQLIISDRDNGTATYEGQPIIWYYAVEVSKNLTMIPHGPASGRATALSKKYRDAAGIGEGRVWAKDDSGVSGFEHVVNCQKAKTWTIYGYGYKVGDVEGALRQYPERDIKIDDAGNSQSTLPAYRYEPSDKRDSFLYTWLQVTRVGGKTSGSSSGSQASGDSSTLVDMLLNNTILPEYPELKDTGAIIGLPTEQDDDGAYDETIAEAIFSKELYPADNMGDINSDGIPDIYFAKYFQTPATGTAGEGGETAGSVDDLANLATANADKDKNGGDAPDYLPASLTAPTTVFTGLADEMVDFKALWEIRGFGAGLNDATATLLPNNDGTKSANPCGIVGVKPDRHYTDPDLDDPSDPEKISTLTKVEWLAWSEFKAAHPEATEDDWSPERPTSPVLSDTDGDGFSDGFEYYFWYRAHVGYLDVDGNHRYLTGRRFDERNPGEGVLIPAEEIARLMDPITPADASAVTQDTDNDGLPDLLEFELGTNPFDFDTDGDGLPDGWEIMIAGTDPLSAASFADAVSDPARNSDGDAMAITSAKLEKNVRPTKFYIDHLNTLAVLNPAGDTDGVQWYALKGDVSVALATNTVKMWSFQIADRLYVTAAEPAVAEDAAGVRLAVNLAKDATFTVATNVIISADKATTNLVCTRGYPVYLTAGAKLLAKPVETDVDVLTVANGVAAKDANACWIYGKGAAANLLGEVAETAAQYGCLAIARNLAIPQGAVVCAAPSTERDVAYLHYLVYQEFGFDPRTAWKAKSPLADRWNITTDGEAYEGVYVAQQGGYCTYPTRTRAYAAYDEFLVHSFFVNNGCDMSGVTYVSGDKAPVWARIWGAFTTNPQGKGDAVYTEKSKTVTTTDGKTVEVTYFGKNDENGADTDGDGVPDGWELYIMAGPKTEKKGGGLLAQSWLEFTMAPPYAGFTTAFGGTAEKSYWSPFVASAQEGATGNQIYLGGQANSDTLNEYEEFEGTDTMAYYADLSTTIVHVGEWKWLNKFFPTDPWNVDTDGDGLSDKIERDGRNGITFIYAGNEDTGKTRWIAGGGLNPCSVDTDLDGLPDGWELQFGGKTLGENAKDGYIDGMDGTVQDAVTLPGGVNRDYDHDGLENWQEYLVGTMRCWRYDDPFSSWTYMPDDAYVYDEIEVGGATNKVFNATKTAEKLGYASAGEFWYNTLVDKTSPNYNPHLITGMGAGSQYFSRVTNGWDVAFIDPQLVPKRAGGAYYYFYHRIGEDKISDLWVGKDASNKGPLFDLVEAIGCNKSPTKYISCSPILADSDKDGMDDYYELFHGMNPLLGASGALQTYDDPCDLVFDAWAKEGVGFEAWGSGLTANYWQRDEGKAAQAAARVGSNGYDFEVYPWLNGLATADPDGDDIRNQEEAIMPMINPTTAWHHTDPTPLWMTDSSYTNSLTRMFFRLPTRFDTAVVGMPGEESFTHKGTTYFFRDFDGYLPVADAMSGKNIPTFLPFTPDAWKLAVADAGNWIASFEENEGYDSDHDGISDYEELQGKFRSASDPQDVDSPRRRQAMYFPGTNSILQTMPLAKEEHPRGATQYPDDMSFLQYTVECWVLPESVADATIIERAIWTDYSNPGDKEFMRKNFQLAIKEGKWYTKFDPSGTLASKQVEVFSSMSAEVGKWAHLAATYNGTELVLYVNGIAQTPVKASLQPEYGASAVSTRSASVADGQFGTYWRDREYEFVAIIVGASAKCQSDNWMFGGYALDLTYGMGFSAYKDFFKGYVDEVRIWDGVRTADEIRDAMKTRFTAEMAKENRNDFYDAWSQPGAADLYRGRYAKDASGNGYALPAELRYHFAFDSIYGAENAASVARAPHGFDNGEKAPLSRPVGYGIRWLDAVVNGYAESSYQPGYGSVYDNPAWAMWVPNTVAHLPRFDGTTLDSCYWSEDLAGIAPGTYKFARTAEPVSYWTQMIRNQVIQNNEYDSTSTRYHFVNDDVNSNNNYKTTFEFTARHLNQLGDDMLPLGGAYVKYVGEMWDEQGASDAWEISPDSQADGLPTWWAEEYGVASWDDIVSKEGEFKGMKAGDAYLLDLRKNGAYRDAAGKYATDAKYVQTADADGDGMYDWWEDTYGIQGNSKDDAEKDPDNDGLSNYQEFLVSMGDSPYGFMDLNPFSRVSLGQNVPDYFLPVPEGGDGAGGKYFFPGEYLGAVLTDHDFMEDWWENKYANEYVNSRVYDPWDDTDGDGWSNFAECRAALWGHSFMASLIDGWTGLTSDMYVTDYPEPIIGVRVTYTGHSEISGVQLVIRTLTGQTPRTDATFVIPPTLDSQVRYLGAFEGGPFFHGHLSPGRLNPNSVVFEYARYSSDKVYSWNCDWYRENESQEWGWDRGSQSTGNAGLDWLWWENCQRTHQGSFDQYRAEFRKWPKIELEGGDLQWEAFAETRQSGDVVNVLMNGNPIGVIDATTGEFALDMSRFSLYADYSEYVFRVTYMSRVGHEWPQKVYVSDTKELAAGTGINGMGNGYVREGLNTIEAFIDLDGNGTYDVGEPYGVAKNVKVGWHKVPEVTIELTDTSKVVQRTAIVATSDKNDKTDGEGAETTQEKKGGSEGAEAAVVNVRVSRKLINGSTAKERVLMAKEFVMDDRAYLTEADVLTTKNPDLDWRYLNADATKAGIASVDSVTYSIESYEMAADGTCKATPISTFTRVFDSSRPKVAAVSPINAAPVYTAAPTFRFTADDQATAFSVQIANASGSVIFDSGIKMLGGRDTVEVGLSAYSYTPPIYADALMVSNGAPVFVDGASYKWRVVAYNAKFNTASEADYSEWTPFRMDAAGKGGNKDQTTGYGKANAIVRYYGLARRTANLENLIVVEAFENADFTGQAMAQSRVGDLGILDSVNDAVTPNATLVGLKPGVVYLRAYIDLNNNGKWDKFEPWGYANDRQSTHVAIYNPIGVEVGATSADWVNPNSAVIFIEDTDYDKNEIPDCKELYLFPETTEAEDVDDDTSSVDWWSWAGVNADEADYAAEGDVMAYAEVDRTLVILGLEGDDTTVASYLLAKGEKMPRIGDQGVAYKYQTCYPYGTVQNGVQLYGLGTNAVLASEAFVVKAVSPVKVALVHNQVYQEFGYDTLTANPVAFTNGTAVNTKEFTALDKKMLLRYFAAIGYVDAADFSPSGKNFDDYLDELALTKPSKVRELWAKYSLKLGNADSNGDGIYDGWQLYVMFGPEGELAASTPWTGVSASRQNSPSGEGLTWVQEWDSGDYPTDPWAVSTFKQTYTTDEGTFTISDKDAYDFHLKGTHQYEDADNDGLINYEEYVIQKNQGHALNVDKMCTYFGLVTIPELTGQCVPDYFLKSLRSPKYYEGFKHTSHDFMLSTWKDQYGLDRKRFAMYDDPDDDGWDNWSEARAGTSPVKVSESAIDDYTINQFPTPIINLSLTRSELSGANATLVVEAYSKAGGSTSPDATWVIGDKAGGDDEKFLGFNPGIQKTYNLGGAIVPGTFALEIKDLTADYETWDSNKTHRISRMKIARGEAVWSAIVVDTKTDNDASWGYLVLRADGDTIVGTIDYATGDAVLDFGMLNEIYGGTPWRTWMEGTTCIASYPWKSYVKATWTTKAMSANLTKTQQLTLSDATQGRLIQGYATFVAYDDANGNGTYDPGEPFGMAKDVDVGWDRVTDLNIALTKSSPVMPRFNPLKLSEAAQAEEGENASNTVHEVIAGKPVVVDVTKDTYVRVVRWAINDTECKRRVVLSKKIGSFEAATEADVLSKKAFDLDWKNLEKDAHDAAVALKDINKIVYAVFVGDVGRTEENVNGWIIKKFPHNRANATLIAPTATDTAIVNAARPEFVFKVPDGYPSYAFKLMDEAGNVVFCSTNLVTAKNADGNVAYRPPVYFGAEAADCVNRLLPTGTYSWSVAMLNAKFRSTEGGWAAPATFDQQMAKGRVHDTDKGILEVAVRYYGEGEISAEHPIIVQAFRTADFTGIPDGQAVITNAAGVLNVYCDTNTVNATMYGLVPGTYYVRAFLDTTNDVVLSTWESWGYQNKVDTGLADLYTPVATEVKRNDTSFALVFMEDMDTNNDGIPDCTQPFKPDDAHDRRSDGDDADSDGDGIPDREEEDETGTDPYDWDTDGDGMPDGWEEWAGTDPLTPDADYAAPGDVMAYEEVEMWLITLEDGTELLLKDGETVPKPGDSLANYGEVFYVPYWYGVRDGDGVYGRGQKIAAPEGAMVNGNGDHDPRKVTVALVHDQVYDEFGFDPNTAVPGGTVHTKEFAALDKYLLLRYREMMGSDYWPSEFDPAILESGDYDDIEDYVNQRKLWPDWTLKPGYPDGDAQPANPETGEAGIGDGIGDGWELFNRKDPWNYFDRASDDDGDGAKLIDEYGYDPETGKANPTDPRNPDTDGDGVTDDLYHAYNLFDPAGDADGDGLSNYAEYLITEVFKYDNLDPKNPMTDGHCVDYFRKIGDLYYGEIFTDHDQVNDTWETHYNDVANSTVYDPCRDDDEDGWSNYAECRADTNPREVMKLGVTDAEGVTYVHPEYPVPVIAAKVAYNGKYVMNLDNLVFKAWSEKTDPDMTAAPDAVWTVPTIPGDGETTLTSHHKYLDRKPHGTQRYLLAGGDVSKGTLALKVLNQSYVHVGIPAVSSNETASASNKVQKAVAAAGDPTAAQWYVAARDINGKVVTYGGAEIGTVDYSTGIVDIDFNKLAGDTVADPSTGRAFADRENLTDGGHDYDLFSFDDANLLLTWSAAKAGTDPAGIYYLAEADAATAATKSYGHVREGLNTFVCFVDSDGDGQYTAGELFGFVRGVDVGWQGARFEVEISECSPVFARVNINDGSNDRVHYWGIDSGDVDYKLVNSNDIQVAEEALSGGIFNHVRIVPYMIGGTTTDTALYDRGYVPAVLLLQNRVVAEFDVNTEAKPFITEADFMKGDAFDIDWEFFDTDAFAQHKSVYDAVGDVTAVKYRIVLGKDGPVGPEHNLDTTTVVRAFSTLIERRYEPVAKRTKPTGLKLAEGILYGARPTFRWRLDESTDVANYAASAALYGCSYTAFQIEVVDTRSNATVYRSGVQRAPVKDKEGFFNWRAPVSAGDQTALGQVFARAGNYKWRVAMYNSKFRPGGTSDIHSGRGWSEYDTFSTAVGMQQVTGDHGYSAINVAVKYTGPEKVLDYCEDVTTTEGMVRVQAFTTADFSGEPEAETFVADKASLVDVTSVTNNCTLYGLLPKCAHDGELLKGTYYIRAYIDSNGNFKKDDWESWGYAKVSVPLYAEGEAPTVGLYIEDADTDQDWLPDAWEYVTHGDLDHENTYVDPEGKIVLKTMTYAVMTGGKANFSTKLPGASLTLFENLDAAKMLLKLGNDTTVDTITAIRAAIEKNVVPNTVKISAITVDTEGKKVRLAVNADVADSIAGQILSPVYILPQEKTKVTVRLYKKSSLVVKEWTWVNDYEATIDTSLSTTVEIPLKDVDFSSGFYKAEVVQ